MITLHHATTTTTRCPRRTRKHARATAVGTLPLTAVSPITGAAEPALTQSAPAMLNWLPLQAPRGKLLQLVPFDEPYLERLRAGDFRTQEHFVSYFGELIQLKLRSRLRSPQAIEDVRQETFARVFAALREEGKIRQPERLGSYVNSTCRNVLLEHYRSASRSTPLEDEDDQDFPDQRIDFIGAIAAKQMEKKVQQILDELPERDRRLLRAVFLEERDKDEVCRELGVDRDYLRVLLHRAKQAFKALYLNGLAA